LGTLVLDQGDAAGLLAVDERARLVPPRSGRHHLRVFMSQLAQLAPEGGTGIGAAVRQAASVMKRRGLVIVVSDFYEEDEALPQVRRLARMGHDVVVIHTLAREELSLDVGGAAEFVDLETGRTLMVQPSAVRDGYTTAVQQWLAKVRDAVTRDGMEYLRLVTGEPLEPALRRFLMQRRGGG
ncbi:MAG: VWA domain-containing protein, partial [Vicinamibacterales bacterium]